MIGIVSFVVVFSVLVMAHELGHFVVAKLAGVRVEEFGIGYPPRLLTLGTWRQTRITLNALPIGGYVRMGEDDPSSEGNLAAKSRLVRAIVLVSGAVMNVVLAVLLFSITFMIGAPTPVEGPGAGIYHVVPGSPAERVGLMPGDTIVTIDGEAIIDVDHAVEAIKARVGRPVEIVVRRRDQMLSPMTATPRVNPPPNEGALGVSLDLPLEIEAYPVWRAVPMGFRATFSTVRGMFWGLQAAVRKEIPFEISGPIGIYQTTKRVAKSGVAQLLEFAAFLSMNLFLINLLPFPALDGGRVIFVVIEWLRGGRRVPPEKEALVHALGMMALIAAMIVVTSRDYVRYFG